MKPVCSVDTQETITNSLQENKQIETEWNIKQTTMTETLKHDISIKKSPRARWKETLLRPLQSKLIKPTRRTN